MAFSLLEWCICVNFNIQVIYLNLGSGSYTFPLKMDHIFQLLCMWTNLGLWSGYIMILWRLWIWSHLTKSFSTPFVSFQTYNLVEHGLQMLPCMAALDFWFRNQPDIWSNLRISHFQDNIFHHNTSGCWKYCSLVCLLVCYLNFVYSAQCWLWLTLKL